MRILVTGGLGFIGSHLVARLSDDGHELFILDDLSTGKREHAPAGSKVIIDDVARSGVYDELLPQVDACYHLAAIASVERSHQEWLRTHQVNTGGLINLFDAIHRQKKPIPVVYASSAAVYGDNTSLPLKEKTYTQPISSYGADKLSCELGGRVAERVHNIPNIGLRFFNVFGPRQDPSSPYSGVISIFAQRALQNRPLTIYGDGEQSRDFIFVEDVVRCLMLSMRALEDGIVKQDVFNVCRGREITVNELAQTIYKLLDTEPNITHDAARVGDIRHSLGDSSKAKQILKFEAKTSFSDGLRLTLDWLKTQS